MKYAIYAVICCIAMQGAMHFAESIELPKPIITSY